MTTLATLLLGLLPQTPDSRPARPFETTRLDNGALIHVACVEGAEQVASFTFLPIGLDGDALEHAQFAHLAEHMLIYGVDSELRPGRLEINGETTARAMRLECLGPPAEWRSIVTRHPRWLSVREVDAEILTREKIRIAGEEQNTVPQGHNHKWATAAWAQIARGAARARVHGDVADSDGAKLERYLRRRVHARDAQIYVIGPTPSRAVVEAIRREFARVPAHPPASQPAASRPAKPALQTAGHRDATWDLDAGHYLEWYPLGADATAAEANLVARALTMACFQTRKLRNLPGRAAALPIELEGRQAVLLSAGLSEELGIQSLQRAFEDAIEDARGLARHQPFGEMLANQVEALPNFEAQRESAANARFRTLLEANWALQVGYACLRARTTPARVAEAYRGIRPERLAERISEHCRVEHRRSIRLTFTE